MAAADGTCVPICRDESNSKIASQKYGSTIGGQKVACVGAVYTIESFYRSIEDIIDEKPYLQARVAYFDDAMEEKTEALAALVNDGIKLLQELDILTGKRTDYNSVSELDPTIISFLLAYNDEFTPAEKQEFLAMTSTRQRIIESAGALRKMVERFKRELVIKKIVGGNGNLGKRTVPRPADKIYETE